MMIKEDKLVVSAALILIVLAVFCVALRARFLLRSDQTSKRNIWRLTYEIEIPRAKGTRVYIAVPDNTGHCRVFKESFSYDGLWMDTVKSSRTRTREVVVVPLLGSGQGRLTADFDIHLNKEYELKTPGQKKGLTAQEVSHYLREEPAVQISAPVVSDILGAIKTSVKNKSELLNGIFDYCSENIIQIEFQGSTDAVGALEHRSGTGLGCVRAMIALCRAAKIPARVVSGFNLTTRSEPQMYSWVEAFVKNSWRPYDPVNGYRGELPPGFVRIRIDGNKLVRTSGDIDLRAQWSIHPMPESPITETWATRGWLRIADLTRLTPGMQHVLAIVLLLPIGALMTAVLRNMVGIRTFGTFAPTLIALSLVQADWRTGALALVVVLGMGVLARLFLNKLKILMVPRLGVILTLVVLTMILGISVLDHFGLTPTASAALLPMVILTMMVERFNITAEEDGYREALKVLAGTLLAATCCLLLLHVEYLSRLVLVFPEVLLLVAAALLLIGRYTGYRLTELWRFRDFATGDLEGRP
jgi:transglutaminase-like putative cysteine protease